MIDGVPQDGTTLGRARAPATLTVYASLTDLNSGFVRRDLPSLVGRFVRPGRLRIQLRTLTGFDDAFEKSRAQDRLARTAQAVGRQDRFWNFYLAFDAIYQGSFTRAQMETALKLTPGLDGGNIRPTAASPRIGKAIARGNAMARAAKVKILPAYVLSTRGMSATIRGECDHCLARNVNKTIERLSARAEAAAKKAPPGPKTAKG